MLSYVVISFFLPLVSAPFLMHLAVAYFTFSVFILINFLLFPGIGWITNEGAYPLLLGGSVKEI